jgi:plastocyanin
MPMRRILVAATAFTLAASLLAAVTFATAEEEKTADFLFVQSAKSMSFDPAANKLTLKNVVPSRCSSPIGRSGLPEI